MGAKRGDELLRGIEQICPLRVYALPFAATLFSKWKLFQGVPKN